MSDPRVRKLAELLVQYSVAVKPGDKVLINGSTLAAPLLREIYACVLQSGGHPLMQAVIPGMDEIFYKYASDAQITFVPPPSLLGVETYDVAISISGALNTKSLSGVDPAKSALHSQSRREMYDIFMNRAAKKELRWTTALFPTNAYAQDAEMSLDDYEDFVYCACMPDLDDPIAYWRAFSERQGKIAEWLRDRKEIRVTGPRTDLTVRVDDRIFISCDGHFNMPDGEVFTGPQEGSAEGYVGFSYPAIFQGREVTGVRLEFKGGKVVRASADKNEDFLNRMLDTDEGARRLGEFAIGTNEGIRRFTRQILFDEKIGGSFHIALGAGYPETGSLNQSSIHWDMICDLRDGGEIWVDGTLLYKNGRFTIPF
ncbi:MAG: aminopeptidase [Syntrophales bacterium]|nr:aminopeptidase [Syntrophales bacterium]